MASNVDKMKSASGKTPDFGAIFMSNKATISECFERKLFGLPRVFGDFVKEVKAGMVLFLFEYERRKLYGVFQAITNGKMDIVPHAYCSSGKLFPAQVQFSVIWNCHPLFENDFRDAIRDNYFAAYKFNFGLSKDQVQRLLCLFYSRKVKVQRSLTKKKIKKRRLKSLDKPIALVESLDKEIALVDSGKLGLDKEDSMVESRSDLGDYIPLSSPEHIDPAEMGRAFSEAGNSKSNQTEFTNCDGYEDVSSEAHIFPMPFRLVDSDLSSPVHQSDNYPTVKGLYSDILDIKTSVFSRMDLVSKLAAEENEDNFEVTETVHDIMERLQQLHKKRRKETRKTKSITLEKGDTSMKKRASVFSRLNFASKSTVKENEINPQLDKLTGRAVEVSLGKKKKRGREVLIRSHDDGGNFNMIIQVETSEIVSRVEKDPKEDSIPLLNFNHKGEILKTVCETEGTHRGDAAMGVSLSEEQQKKRRLVGLMFTNKSDAKTEVSDGCPNVHIPSQGNSNDKETGEN